MKKLLIVLLFFSYQLSSQIYVELAQDTSLTFEEIVTQTELYFDDRGRGKHTGYKQWKRWEYWTRRSLGPEDKIITNTKAYNEVTRFDKEHGNVMRSANGHWEDMGPTSATNTSTWSSHIGRISAIGLDENDENHIIVGSPSGGVWKTLDEGISWSPIFDNETIINVYSLAISHADSDVYLCGTYGLGVMKSTDGGSSWTTTSGIGTNTWINRIAIDPTDANIVLAVNQWGDLYRSTDGGDNWTTILNNIEDIYDIEYKPGDSNIIYVSSDGEVYKSTDNGVSFTALSGPWSNDPMMMAVTADDPDYLYVLRAESGGYGALYLSEDEGATFSTQSDNSSGNNNIMGYNMNQTGGQAPRDMDVVVNPNDKTEVHVAGVMTFKSTNSGATWSQTTHWVISNPLPFIHADCDLMFYQGSKIYFGTDGGIFISPDGGTTFDDKTSGLGIRQFYRIGVSETDVDRVSGGSQDNGTGTVEAGAWIDWVGADGMETFIAKHDEDIQYASIQFGSLYKTVNGGNSLTGINNTPGSGDWVTPLEEDPIVNNTLYQGKAQLYKSSNGGSSWTTISSFSPSNSNDVNLVEVTVAPTDNDVIFAAYRHQIFRTTNGGTSWIDVSPTHSFSNVNYINIHPTNSQKVLIVLSGTTQKVMESTDQGVTWTDITASLPSVGAECAIYEGGSANGIYVSMNPGVYYMSDNTASWETYELSLPNVRVAELEIRNDFIYAATYGRGLWKNDLVSNASCNINSITDLGATQCTTSGGGSYTRNLEINYSSAPATGTLVVNGFSFGITGSPQVISLEDQPLNGATIDVTATFSDDTNCTATELALYTNPTGCPCSISSARELLVSCNGNGTGTVSDDTFTFSIDPVGNNTGTTYSVTGDVSASNLSYGAVHTFDNGGAGYLVSDGNINFDIIDDVDPSCTLTGVQLVAPSTCSENYTCADALTITGPGIYTAIGPDQGNGGSNAGRQANWFVYIAPSDGFLTVHSCEMEVDTRLFLHDGTCASLNQLATSDDDCPLAPGSSDDYASEIVDYCVNSGTTYYIEWDDRWSQSGFDFEVVFTTNTYYADNDGDGYGDINSSTLSCTPPSGYVTDNTDCNDSDSTSYPGNTETCDGVDNNCDGIVDEGVINTYYADTDNDGYGDANNTSIACSAPTGYVTDNTDCDDSDSNNYPGNTEACDGLDNNCDGVIDEGCGGAPICDDIYLVINTLLQDVNRAEINITSSAAVNSTNPVYFYAGTDIDLNPNFEVVLGTEFNAIIQNCTPPPAPGGDSEFYSIKDLQELDQYFQRAQNSKKLIKVTLLDKDKKAVFEESGTGEVISHIQEYVAEHDKGQYVLKLRFLK